MEVTVGGGPVEEDGWKKGNVGEYCGGRCMEVRSDRRYCGRRWEEERECEGVPWKKVYGSKGGRRSCGRRWVKEREREGVLWRKVYGSRGGRRYCGRRWVEERECEGVLWGKVYGSKGERVL